MTKITKTYQQILDLDDVITDYLIKNGYFADGKWVTEIEDTKLVASIRDISNQMKKIFKKYNKEKNDILRDNSLVDEKTKKILYDVTPLATGGVHKDFCFTIAGRKAADEAIDKLTEEGKAVLHARIAVGDDWKLTEDERSAFEGLIIPMPLRVEEKTKVDSTAAKQPATADSEIDTKQ